MDKRHLNGWSSRLQPDYDRQLTNRNTRQCDTSNRSDQEPILRQIRPSVPRPRQIPLSCIRNEVLVGNSNAWNIGRPLAARIPSSARIKTVQNTNGVGESKSEAHFEPDSTFLLSLGVGRSRSKKYSLNEANTNNSDGGGDFPFLKEEKRRTDTSEDGSTNTFNKDSNNIISTKWDEKNVNQDANEVENIGDGIENILIQVNDGVELAIDCSNNSSPNDFEFGLESGSETPTVTSSSTTSPVLDYNYNEVDPYGIISFVESLSEENMQENPHRSLLSSGICPAKLIEDLGGLYFSPYFSQYEAIDFDNPSEVVRLATVSPQQFITDSPFAIVANSFNNRDKFKESNEDEYTAEADTRSYILSFLKWN